MDEFRYLVLLDGVPDREDTPYREAESALSTAKIMKHIYPNSVVAVQIIFEQ